MFQSTPRLVANFLNCKKLIVVSEATTLEINVQGCSVIYFLQGVSLCTEYNVDAESFIEQWMAFSLTVLNGASPTLENLELLAKREFSKRSASRPNALPDEVTNSSTGTSLTVYGAHAAIPYPYKTYYTCLL